MSRWDVLARPLRVTAIDGSAAELPPGIEFAAHVRPGDEAGVVRVVTFTRREQGVWMEFWGAREDELRGAATDPTFAIGRPAARPLRLAIVGSRSLDGNPDALRVIRSVLDAYQAHHPDLTVVTGGAIGIDRMAAAEARRRGLEVIEHLPAGRAWRQYRERNLRIAKDCDELVRIADPHSRTFGSGWTRDRARELGRPTTEYAITGRPAAPCAHAAAALRGKSDARP